MRKSSIFPKKIKAVPITPNKIDILFTDICTPKLKCNNVRKIAITKKHLIKSIIEFIANFLGGKFLVNSLLYSCINLDLSNLIKGFFFT